MGLVSGENESNCKIINDYSFDSEYWHTLNVSPGLRWTSKILSRKTLYQVIIGEKVEEDVIVQLVIP